MAVYVDREQNAYRGMKMCHMFADSLDELHAMADRIGLKKKWFQGRKTPHYDVCQSKRRIAVRLGAVEINRRQAVTLIRASREKRNYATQKALTPASIDSHKLS